MGTIQAQQEGQRLTAWTGSVSSVNGDAWWRFLGVNEGEIEILHLWLNFWVGFPVSAVKYFSIFQIDPQLSLSTPSSSSRPCLGQS